MKTNRVLLTALITTLFCSIGHTSQGRLFSEVPLDAEITVEREILISANKKVLTVPVGGVVLNANSEFTNLGTIGSSLAPSCSRLQPSSLIGFRILKTTNREGGYVGLRMQQNSPLDRKISKGEKLRVIEVRKEGFPWGGGEMFGTPSCKEEILNADYRIGVIELESESGIRFSAFSWYFFYQIMQETTNDIHLAIGVAGLSTNLLSPAFGINIKN